MNRKISHRELEMQISALTLKNPLANIVIDGRSGSGKTTLAESLLEGLPEQSYEFLSLEDLYAGWSGLRQGHDTLVQLLKAKAAGESCQFQIYDWYQGRFSETRTLDPQRIWLVEGCCSISSETIVHADLSIWIELSDAARRERISNRDPDFIQWWLEWNRQHDAFIAEEHSPRIASFIFGA